MPLVQLVVVGVVLLEVLLLLLPLLVPEVEVVVLLELQPMVLALVLQVVPSVVALQEAPLAEVQLGMLELQQTALATRLEVTQHPTMIRMPSDASAWKRTRPRIALAQ